jgi:hypothetical protein
VEKEKADGEGIREERPYHQGGSVLLLFGDMPYSSVDMHSDTHLRICASKVQVPENYIFVYRKPNEPERKAPPSIALRGDHARGR